MKKILIIMSIAAVLYAQEEYSFSDPEVTGSDSVIFQQSSVDLIESDEDSDQTGGAAAAVGVRIVITDKTSIFILPLSYKLPAVIFGGKLTLGAGIPWVEKEVRHPWTNKYEKVSGVGDISVSAELDKGNEEDLRKISTLIIKFPTGATDEKLADGNAETTLGSGGTDIAAALTLVKRKGLYRYLAGVGYRLNGDWDSYEGFGLPGTVDYGDAVNALAGIEYKYSPELSPYLHFRAFKKGETRVIETKQADDLLAGDLIAGFRYRMRGNMQISFALEFPVIRDYNSAFTGDKDKNIAFNFGLNKVY
ncbi:MAG: hypothetical protein Q7J59_03930 [Elusimicrobiota bacterium]|nr:hypothetical protein [Elusimicrobiota bacterium]